MSIAALVVLALIAVWLCFCIGDIPYEKSMRDRTLILCLALASVAADIAILAVLS